MRKPKPKKKQPSAPTQLPTPKALRTLSNEALALQLICCPKSPDDRDPNLLSRDPQEAARLVLNELSSPNPKRGTTKANASTIAWVREHLPTLPDLLRNEINPAFAEIEAIRAVADEVADYCERSSTKITQLVEGERHLRVALERVLAVGLLSGSTRNELQRMLVQLAWLDAIGDTAKSRLRDQVFLFRLFEYFNLALRNATVASIFTSLFSEISGQDEGSASRIIIRIRLVPRFKHRSGEVRLPSPKRLANEPRQYCSGEILAPKSVAPMAAITCGVGPVQNGLPAG